MYLWFLYSIFFLVCNEGICYFKCLFCNWYKYLVFFFMNFFFLAVFFSNFVRLNICLVYLYVFNFFWRLYVHVYIPCVITWFIIVYFGMVFGKVCVWRWLWVDVDELYICGCVSGCVGVYGVFLIIIFTRESWVWMYSAYVSMGEI